MSANVLVFDTDEVEELQTLIESLANDEAMDAGVLDGVLTAHALVPDAKPFDLVYPYLFSADGRLQAVPDNARLRELVELRRNVIAAALSAGHGFDPVILPVLDDNDCVVTGPEGVAAVEPWIAGLRVGLMLVTGTPPEMSDEARDALARLVALAPADILEFTDEDRQSPAYAAYNELPAVTPDDGDLESALQCIVAGVYALKKAWLPNRPLRHDAPKVGRNDPCPCGSGKKYKQCCGKKA